MATAFQPPVNSGSVGDSYTVPAGRYAYVSLYYTLTGNTGTASVQVSSTTISAASGQVINGSPFAVQKSGGSDTVTGGGGIFLMATGTSVSKSTSGDGSAVVTIHFIEFNEPT